MPAVDEIILPAIGPFDLHATVEALHRRPNALAEPYIDGEYRRILWLDGEPVLIGARQVGPDAMLVRPLANVGDEAQLRRAAQAVAQMLGASVDLSEAQSHARRVPELAPLVEQLTGMKPPRFNSLWETLVNVIPFQQVSLASGVATLNRLVEALGPRIEHAGRVYFGLPSPQSILDAEVQRLRACGFSAAKVGTLRGAAEQIASGALDDAQIAALSDADAIARLTQLPGIGPWSAQLVLLRGFRRLGVFPQGDSGAARSLAGVLGLPIEDSQRRAPAILEALGPWRGYLYFLLLGSRLLRQGILPGIHDG